MAFYIWLMVRGHVFHSHRYVGLRFLSPVYGMGGIQLSELWRGTFSFLFILLDGATAWRFIALQPGHG